MKSNVAAPSQEQHSDDHDLTTAGGAGPDVHVTPAPAVMMTCSLCDAEFSPESEYAYLLNADAKELEAAFMSACHVCFRCRRAACPECWDATHHLCAQCVGEAGLPPHTEPRPLEGTLPLIMTAQDAAGAATASPFVCVRPGRYSASAEREPDRDRQQSADPALLPVKKSDSPAGTENIHHDPTPRLVALAIADQAGTAEETLESEPAISGTRRTLNVIERALTIIVLAALLIIAALVVLAETSLPANTTIARLIHVDIRAEVAYIVNLIKNIHW